MRDRVEIKGGCWGVSVCVICLYLFSSLFFISIFISLICMLTVRCAHVSLSFFSLFVFLGRLLLFPSLSIRHDIFRKNDLVVDVFIVFILKRNVLFVVNPRLLFRNKVTSFNGYVYKVNFYSITYHK